MLEVALQAEKERSWSCGEQIAANRRRTYGPWSGRENRAPAQARPGRLARAISGVIRRGEPVGQPAVSVSPGRLADAGFSRRRPFRESAQTGSRDCQRRRLESPADEGVSQ